MIKYYKLFNFSPSEQEFIQYVLDDPRAWDVTFKDIKKSNMKPNILVYKTPGNIINKLYPQEHLQNLSLTDTTNDPIIIHLRKENWDEGRGGYTNVWMYRTYLVLHEFGHAIGYGHAKCLKKGDPAPVMMQQTKGTYPCYPDPWVVKYIKK